MKIKLFLVLIIILWAVYPGFCQEEKPQSTHPVWSPDGSKIAFINNHFGVENKNAINFEVYTMNADGSNIKRHTINTAFEAEICWSPNGQNLAFKSYRDKNDEVYLLDLTSGEQTNISNHQARDGGPVWSNNGKFIYFYSDKDHEKGELYRFKIKNKKIKRITRNDFRESGAVWSPNGKQVAFVSDIDGDDDIYIMDVSGKNLRQLTNNELNDWYPQWSPDGRQIIFTYGDWETDIWETRIIDLDGSNEKTLIKEVDSGNANWHPDGSKIVFASGKSGYGEIYILDLKTGKEEKITDKAK